MAGHSPWEVVWLLPPPTCSFKPSTLALKTETDRICTPCLTAEIYSLLCSQALLLYGDCDGPSLLSRHFLVDFLPRPHYHMFPQSCLVQSSLLYSPPPPSHPIIEPRAAAATDIRASLRPHCSIQTLNTSIAVLAHHLAALPAQCVVVGQAR